MREAMFVGEELTSLERLGTPECTGLTLLQDR